MDENYRISGKLTASCESKLELKTMLSLALESLDYLESEFGFPLEELVIIESGYPIDKKIEV